MEGGEELGERRVRAMMIEGGGAELTIVNC